MSARRISRDRTGMRFGARVAVRYVGHGMWIYRCDCGSSGMSQLVTGYSYLCRHDFSNRFWSKVDKTGACWNWIAGRSGSGYGSFLLNGSYRCAHVVSWEAVNGDVPDGMELDHLCRNQLCVRPDHLEPVTHAENVRRGMLSQVTRERHRRNKIERLHQ